MNNKAQFDISEIIIFAVIVIIFILIVFMIRVVEINYFDNVPSVVMVDGKEVYKGTSAGFDTESNGYATKVVIKSGFLYLFPQKVYVSKDVEVIGTKE